MNATLLRTGSITVQTLNRCPSGSPTLKFSHNDAVSFRATNKGFAGIRRSNSDTDMIRSEESSRLNRIRSASSFLDMSSIFDPDTEFDPFTKRGGNENNKKENKSNVVEFDEKKKIGDHYLDLLKANPGDALVLRNYGKYLHEVEKNNVKAEEYYGRAILAASEGDGELLALYGKLIWENHKDEDRAQSYFDRAVKISPDDCIVLGSYASFLWESDEDEETVEDVKQTSVIAPPAMIGVH